MICIPGTGYFRIAWPPRSNGCYRILAVIATLVLSLSAVAAMAANQDDDPVDRSRVYQVTYTVTPKPNRGGVIVELRLRQPRRLLRELNMAMGSIDASSLMADGDLILEGDRIVWHPPENGGELRWFIPVNHIRSRGEYDAYMSSAWSLFRSEDIIPSARTRTLRGSRSETRLKFKLPRGWSSTTQYFGRNNDYAINNPARRFDQPAGWVLLGKIGVRYENIQGTRVIVAGPVGHSVRRLDMLALLQWNLPELRRIIPDFSRRLTIISAAGPMWRGGLSAPSSLFMHAGIPLISENGTSALLHEVLHIALGLRAGDGADWIIEGLAEYYGLELLRRSHSISVRRHAAAITSLQDWGGRVKNLCRSQSTGATTARATVIFHALDQELRQHEESNYSLDDVLLKLTDLKSRVTVEDLRDAAAELTGSPLGSIDSNNLPGCAG